MKSLVARNARSASCQLSNLLIKVVILYLQITCPRRCNSILSNLGGVVQPGIGQVPITDTIRRHEVDNVLASQREIVGAVREIK